MKRAGRAERLTVFAALVLLVSAWVCAAPRYGGTFVVAGEGELPTLDSMSPAMAGAAQQMGAHVFETLFAFDNNLTPVPLLAESYAVENDGKRLVIHLRQDVYFHDGQHMTSADVLASMNRWLNHAVAGKPVMPYVESLVADGSYTVIMSFKSPYAPILSTLADTQHACTIIPERIASRYEAAPLAHEDYIGTGPYKFSAWVPRQYVDLVRFDGYVLKGDQPDGWAGARYAYFDVIRYVPIDETTTRLAAIERGEVHYSAHMPADLWSYYESVPGTRPFAVRELGFNHLFLNTKAGVMSSKLMRQALLAALDMEEILIAAYGNPKFYEATGYYYPPGSPFHTMRGTEFYNQHDVARAKDLMRQAGYSGEPIRYLTTRAYTTHYDQAVIITRQLRDAGFNVELVIYDWATVGQLRQDPQVWDLFFTRGIGYRAEPLVYTWMSTTWSGWWDTPARNALVDALTVEMDLDKRAALYHDFQELMYDEVPWVMTGKFSYTGLESSRLSSHHDFRSAVFFFWNMWFED